EFQQRVKVLLELRGGDVSYVPLFTNFPNDLPNDHAYLLKRVLGSLGLDLFDRASFGADPISQRQDEALWQRAVSAQEQKLKDSRIEWIDLTILPETAAYDRLQQWAIDLVFGATPVQEVLWEDLLNVIVSLAPRLDLGQVRIKETLARLAAHEWEYEGVLRLRTPTDLLRMFAFLREQDVSLANKVNFSGLKLSKPQRREIIRFLNTCLDLERDLLRYRPLWISLSKWLHPGDFAKAYPQVASAFDALRNNRIRSFESQVVNASGEQPLALLQQQPSLLLRRLTWLLQRLDVSVVAETIAALRDRAETIPLPLLLTVYAALQFQGARLVVNKQGKAHTVGQRHLLGDLTPVLKNLENLILTQLEGKKNWSTVWIDPALDRLVLPLQVRKQSEGLLNLARGSRIPFGNAEVLRLFVYWQQHQKETDLDLSVLMLDQDFGNAQHVGWNRYGAGEDVAHSGDIQSAPDGAAEFIDIRLASVNQSYLLPTVLRYRGEEFSQLQAAYAGWMRREQVGSDRQTFDARTVAQKVNVNQPGRMWLPFVLDLTTREIIYLDLYANGSRLVEGNPHFPNMVQAIAHYHQAKPTFGQLARWYAQANYATVVADRQQAEVTIGTDDDCTINVLKLVGQEVTSF
ncbi:MAG TPA: TerD family protein, partial [Thermosynechococcaceae cyanobacterium]